MGVKMKIPVLVAEGELSWVAVPGYALCSIRDWMKAPKGQDAKDRSALGSEQWPIVAKGARSI
jgi:hypothetical protein